MSIFPRVQSDTSRSLVLFCPTNKTKQWNIYEKKERNLHIGEAAISVLLWNIKIKDVAV